MLNEHEQFLQDQAKTRSGQKWLEVLKAVADSLYNSRGKQIAQVGVDQAAAEVIEREIISRLELGKEVTKPQKGDEYR